MPTVAQIVAPEAQRAPRRRGRAARLGVVTIEVQLVPRFEADGYLWSYVWTIEPIVRLAAELVATAVREGPGCRRVRILVRRAVRHAARRGLPFGPGTLADYELIESSSVIRWGPAGEGCTRTQAFR